MIRVWGSQTAETLLNIVELRLPEFGVSIDPDVVVMVTDGASITRKLGQNIEHQVQAYSLFFVSMTRKNSYSFNTINFRPQHNSCVSGIAILLRLT